MSQDPIHNVHNAKSSPRQMTLAERNVWQAERIVQLESVLKGLLDWGREQYVGQWDDDTALTWTVASDELKNKPTPVIL